MLYKIYDKTPNCFKKAWRLFKDSSFKWRWIDNLAPSLRFAFSPSKLDENQSEILVSLKENGYAVTNFEKLFGSNEVYLALKGAVDTVMLEKSQVIKDAEEKIGTICDEKTFQLWLLGKKPVLELSSPYAQFALNSRVLDIVNSYFGMRVKLSLYNAWLNFIVRHDPIRSQLWHRDREDKCILKVFVYLNEVDEGSGPMTYVPKTHFYDSQKNNPESFLEENRSNPRSSDEQMENIFPKNRWVKITGKPATIVFVDTTGYHKGGYCNMKERLIFNCMYLSSKGHTNQHFTSVRGKANNNTERVTR